MKDNDHVLIIFDISGYSPALTLAYIVSRANDLHYFNPSLSNSDLFERYNELMQLYTELHGSDYDTHAVERNMEYFFTVGHHLDEEIQNHINNVFGQIPRVAFVHTLQGTDAFITFVGDNSSQVVFEIPAPEKDEAATNTASIHERLATTGNVSVETTDETLHPENAYQELFAAMVEHRNADPEAFVPILTRMQGVPAQDLAQCNLMIRVAIDCLMDEMSYKETPYWYDIVDFLYNYNGESAVRLTKYLMKRQELLAQGNVAVIAFHDNIIQLQQHFNDIAVGVLQTEFARPLTPLSQWLLAYADYIQLVATIEEGEIE